MTVAEINTVTYGSTGKIMMQIADSARDNGHSVYTYSMKWRKQGKPPAGHKYYGAFAENALHKVLGKLTGADGLVSFFGTLGLINNLKRIKPDVIHLHNLHGFVINLPLLFAFIKKNNIGVVWTLHDCWSFTGHCPHFDIVGCDKWKTGCHKCPQYKAYPQSLFDNSKYMYRFKKEWFTGVKNMMIVTPSEWLAGLVKESYLKNYPIKVINNGIDLNIFKPTESDFRQKHRCENKYIVLGVAFDWGKRKGLDVFIELANRLDSEKYQIVLVGTNDETDKLLPENIISIHRTQNQTELAKIYTAADVFANPTREEVFGLVNVESLACGTPVITFNTGGSPECIDETCGTVVPKNDNDAMYEGIIQICETKPYTDAACLARAKSFDNKNKFKEYVKLYENCSHSS